MTWLDVCPIEHDCLKTSETISQSLISWSGINNQELILRLAHLKRGAGQAWTGKPAKAIVPIIQLPHLLKAARCRNINDEMLHFKPDISRSRYTSCRGKLRGI
ncbi:hypothetical protein FVEG_14801 [Fusarium verticillioides 7600]|uniref:Uncharacterized protein n=1 Tax=Gibberella moniliformis (strain M3125 / FGSC 7600) TaxID=334819 RepID=W7LH01_GIBM7|nr:hypothetical protein FVEG_14801 [Fusarium verticillioides 7600]EWG37821.1 hypothetical protein FVEG_14801 [Fusarium verticillioides 7600]